RFTQARMAGDFGRLERCEASKDLGSVTMPATTDMALLSAAIMAIACVAAIAARNVPTGAN
uniref:hypothetical protein n=1 Tax=Salmonella enterica TaxID=28901 RepID=UPI003297F937